VRAMGGDEHWWTWADEYFGHVGGWFAPPYGPFEDWEIGGLRMDEATEVTVELFDTGGELTDLTLRLTLTQQAAPSDYARRGVDFSGFAGHELSRSLTVRSGGPADVRRAADALSLASRETGQSSSSSSSSSSCLGSNDVSCVCGFRWPSFLTPRTRLSLSSQIVSPRVMSDS
jgi:hypothetical protein